jgi:hypothetical protein
MPASAARKAPVSAPTAREPGAAARYERANTSVGTAVTANSARKKPLSGSRPNAGDTSLRNAAPSDSSPVNVPAPATPSSAMATACRSSPPRNPPGNAQQTMPAASASAPASAIPSSIRSSAAVRP